MVVEVKCGNFTKSGTSNTISTTFKVKALIVYNTTVGATAAGTYQGSGGIEIGISDGTTNYVVATTSSDGVTTADTFVAWTTAVAITHSAHNVVQDTGVATFGGTTDFTITWTNGGTPQTPLFYYIAIGGSDITNAKVMQFDTGTTSTGNHAYTGVGFQPDWGFVIGPSTKTATTTTGTNANACFSSFMSTTKRWAVAHIDADSAFSQDVASRLAKDRCNVRLSDLNAINADADFVSWNSDGFAWNWVDAPAISTEEIVGLFIKGGAWDVGTFTKPAATGAQDQVVTLGTSITPKLVMLTSIGQVAHSAVINELEVSFGATDGTSEGAIWTGCGPTGSDPMINASVKLSNKVLRLATANTTHTSSTTDAECSIVTGGSMATAGQFTLDWTTVGNTTLHEISYVVLGEAAAGTTTVTQTSIQKYDLSKYVSQTSIQKYNIAALITVLQTSIQKYSLRKYLAQTTIQKYRMGGTVIAASIQKYNLRKFLAQTTIHKYTLRNMVATTASIQKYVIRKAVIQATIQKYNLRAMIAQTSIHKYHIISLFGPVPMTIQATRNFIVKFLTKL